MLVECALLIVGFFVLVLGAEILVRGARDIAKSFGISTLIVGLTVVAFGTSAPELFVSLTAAFHGNADVAVGNIIGSNLFNVLIIIGLAALIAPVHIASAIVKREMPIMLFSLALFVLFSIDLKISHLEGGILFAGIIAYLALSYKAVKKGKAALIAIDEPNQEQTHARKTVWNVAFVLAGFVGLVLGANLIVDNATIIARHFGVSDLVIGITLVAIGTSLPELATTIIAALRGEPDLAVGNAIGSNIFNVFCVIGLTGAITPLSVNPAALNFDLLFMLIALLCVWPLMLSRRMGRVKGTIMLVAYFGYIGVVAYNQIVALQ
ncbi:calcium/sodium antiporter [Oligoflexia bacterium]|nr:calcium/sodium antiporter [Oligoflexia bacterium]